MSEGIWVILINQYSLKGKKNYQTSNNPIRTDILPLKNAIYGVLKINKLQKPSWGLHLLYLHPIICKTYLHPDKLMALAKLFISCKKLKFSLKWGGDTHVFLCLWRAVMPPKIILVIIEIFSDVAFTSHLSLSIWLTFHGL